MLSCHSNYNGGQINGAAQCIQLYDSLHLFLDALEELIGSFQCQVKRLICGQCQSRFQCASQDETNWRIIPCTKGTLDLRVEKV